MRLAIFDLDGTLINTIADLGVACNYALKEFGYNTHAAEQYHSLVGNGVNRLIERALPEGEKTEDNVLRLREKFVSYYNEHNKVYTHPYNGMDEVFIKLKQDGWLLAVASNKYQAATENLVEHFFPNTFDAIFGEREGCPRKPNPQIVEDIISHVGLSKEQDNKIIYIGDSDVDMLTAKAACLTAVACTWGFVSRTILEQYNPKYIIDSPQELLQITDKI